MFLCIILNVIIKIVVLSIFNMVPNNRLDLSIYIFLMRFDKMFFSNGQYIKLYIFGIL